MNPRLFKFLPFFILVVVGLGVYFANSNNLPGFDRVNAADRLSRVKLGGDYYVLVKLVELRASQDSGERWDSDGSAPDLSVTLGWRGADIFKSSVKENTFLAQWSTSEVDLRKIALSGQNTSIDDMIKGGRISIRAGESITLSVFDEDLLGIKELAGVVKLSTSELLLGEQTLNFKEGGGKTRHS